MIFDESLPDSIKTAITVAKELWEMKLHNKKPIMIEVSYEPLESGTTISTDAGMEEITNNFIPTALAAQWKGVRDPLQESPDGIISINSELQWDCGFYGQRTSAYHLPTMIMRGIARCLGFISSIACSQNNEYHFYNDEPTVYDKHLYRRKLPLSGMTSYTPEIADFVTSNEVYFDTGAKQYPIFSPNVFLDGESLCSLKDDNSLMSASLGEGNIFMNVDQSTIDILNAIGWNLPLEALGIKCLDIDETGIGSSYKNHTFMLADNNLNIDDFKWSFSLKNKAGNYETISSGKSSTFTIERISTPERYHNNSNGDLEGKIECVYTMVGHEYSAEPFKVSLEQKPQIISISDITRTWDDDAFSLDFNVRYAGADKVTVKVEEEYDYYVRTYRFDSPFFVHAKTGKISGSFYSWVTIEVSNQYGTTRRTLEFPPYFNDDNQAAYEITTSSSCSITEDKDFLLFNLRGELVFKAKELDLNLLGIPSGIYIKREQTPSGIINTSKVVIK